MMQQGTIGQNNPNKEYRHRQHKKIWYKLQEGC